MDNERRLRQIEVIRSLSGLFRRNVCWLAGGWAAEIITGRSSFHLDIDLYLLEGIKLPGKEFLDVHNVQMEGRSFREIKSRGALLFSRHAFELKLRPFHGIRVKTVSPELLFAFADGSPHPREQELEIIRHLKGVDLKKVTGIIRYVPDS